jgi:glyoxylase-like metal-dependent hydrolase (beta-lactamase superfamily II)
VLVSGDALWENGFGIVFPEAVGEPGFDDVERALDLIAALPVRAVVPGHGSAFSDVAAALGRARSRLAGYRADPARHANHAVKVLIVFHLLEEAAQALPALVAWAETTPMLQALWAHHAPRGLQRPAQWIARALDELVSSGAAAVEDGVVRPR